MKRLCHSLSGRLRGSQLGFKDNAYSFNVLPHL
jgi:hypothetical protein